MLMTVLRGEIAIQQSRALVKTFKKNQIDADSIYAFLGAFVLQIRRINYASSILSRA